MSRLTSRMDRLAGRLPPPAPEPAEDLRAVPTPELERRVATRLAELAASPEGRARAGELRAMTAEQLIETWDRLPRFRDRGRRR